MIIENTKNYYLNHDRNCAEAVSMAANDAYNLGLDEKALKLLAGYGGGFGCGSVCGALAGAVAIISLLSCGEKAHTTPGFRDQIGEFMARYEAEMGGTLCKELKPKYVTEEGRCVNTCIKTAELLDAFLKEKGLVK